MNFKPCIYALVDPLELGHIRYIGLTTIERRFEGHAKEARNFPDRQTHKLHWIRKLQSENRTYNIVRLEEFSIGVPEELLFIAEQYHIAQHKKDGHILTNTTDGGEGLLNPSLEIRDKIRTAQKIRWTDPKYRARQSVSFSAGQRLRWQDPQQHIKQSEKSKIGNLIRYQDPEQCIKTSVAAYFFETGSLEERILRAKQRIIIHSKIAEKYPKQREKSIKLIQHLNHRVEELQMVS